jgi:hypothetical protein
MALHLVVAIERTDAEPAGETVIVDAVDVAVRMLEVMTAATFELRGRVRIRATRTAVGVVRW